MSKIALTWGILMHTILYLASSSQARQQLLTQALIPYQVIMQNADESLCDLKVPLRQAVTTLARHKMDHVVMPLGKEGDVAWVLTADTLSENAQGVLQGKPHSREDACVKIRAARAGESTGTAFCLEKKIFKDGLWVPVMSTLRFAQARYIFNVPDSWLDRYFEHSSGLKASGALAIEGYGSLFLESVTGSYSAIVGLPMVELRQALQEFGFWPEK